VRCGVLRRRADLSDNEVISMRAYEPHEAPSSEQQRAIADDLRRYFAKIDEKTKDISDAEQEGNP
jgi:hypothetical protein